MMEVFIPVIFTILGILIGSFLNVLIIRVPKGEDFVKTRSHCTTCNYTLRWYDLIPLLSYLTLGGKCRKCGEGISPIYPIIELINGLMYGFIFYLKGSELTASGIIDASLACLMFSTLLVISIIDLRELIIPDGFVIFIFILGILKIVGEFALLSSPNLITHLIGLFIISLPLLIIAIITKGGMGMGDVKLMAAAGFFLGAYLIVEAFFIGAIIGGIVAIGLVVAKKVKKDTKIPFGPFLAGGIMMTILFGEKILDWYINANF